MSSLNTVMLIGNLGADPEVRRLNNGNQVASFNLCTSETWRDKATGEKKKRDEWHRVVIYNEGLVKICEQYTKKGSKLYIQGTLQTRSYEKEGQKHYATEIVLNFDAKLVLLGDPGRRDRDDGDDDDRGSRGGGRSSGGGGGSRRSEMDDEIPF